MADIELVIKISKEDFEIMKHNIAVNNPLCPLSQEEMVSKVAKGIQRKNGTWIANGDIPKECPFCGEDWDKYVFGDICYTGELPKFCPNCGEDMRGAAE